MKANYRLWNKYPYAGESEPPKNPEEPLAGSWPLYYFKRSKHFFTTLQGKKIVLAIENPNKINWEEELKVVKNTLQIIDPHQIEVAKYWGTGVATKQWTPIIDRLIDTYGVSAPRAARILAVVQAGFNDAFIIAWKLKFKWRVARPDQYDDHLATIVCTPRHPAYPSGHAVMSGTAEVILSYFFPGEKERLQELAEENAISRLYAGVHFPSDNTEGLRLGRQLGHIVTQTLKKQKNVKNQPVDIPYKINEHADLMPPPYRQAIPYNFDTKCQSLIIPTYY